VDRASRLESALILSPRFMLFQPLQSASEIKHARSLVDPMIEDPGNFERRWLDERAWTVVPVASADHFLDSDIELVSAAFDIAGYSECLAVATEPLENTPLCYRLSTSKDALREFNRAAGAFYFMLIPEDRSCAVLCTKDDYYLVGGPAMFVATALESDIEEARRKFAEFAERNPHPGMREGLRGVATRYSSD
jgi:hypothetical protein